MSLLAVPKVLDTTIETVDPHFRVVVVFPDLENHTMRIDLRRLTLAALMLSTSATYSALATAQSFVGDTDTDYYGALGGFASDTAVKDSAVKAVANVDEDEVWINETPTVSAVRQVAASMYIGDDVTPASQTSSPSDHFNQATHYAAPIQSASHNGAGSHGSSPCGSTCDSGCDTGFGKLGSAICADDPTFWMKAELLLWFPQARQTPPLGVRSNEPQAPILNPLISDTAVPFGDSFGGGLVPGFRGDIGRYFADGTFGLGGRVWILGNEDDNLAFGGNGTGDSLGVPFYNTFNGPPLLGEDAIFINFAPVDGRTGGDVAIQTSLSIVAAELYGRALVGKSKNHRFEMLGGYSHFNIADSLAMQVNSIGLPGDQTIFRDRFETRNEFHGGQIGSEISLNRGRWTASSLTKVHLGNMSQRVAVDGNLTRGPFGDPPNVVEAQGLFARGDVIGVREQSVFAFAPEVNLKLGYQFRDHVNFHVGYSFVYWNNVALAGDQMDRNLFVNGTDLGNFGPVRHVDIRTSGFFVQGIDLGATITF